MPSKAALAKLSDRGATVERLRLFGALELFMTNRVAQRISEGITEISEHVR